MALYRLRKLHGQMHEIRREAERKLQQKRVLRAGTPDTVFLIGTPIHPNIGDSAIVLAELAFLKKLLPQGLKLAEVTDDSLRRNRSLAFRSVRRSGKLPILWHGGGNMGDLWLDQEQVRRDVFSSFPKRRIISFPQTIYYSDTESGNRLAKESITYYNGIAGLTLTAREARSFEIMKHLYPDTDIYLMPDIVLFSSAEEFGVRPQQREGVLMCLRNDVEKSIQDDFWGALKDRIEGRGEHCRVTDMGADSIINTENRAEIVREKMQEFRGAKMVVTDRLHGMVFAALTETPCVVFSNYNHKVKSTYDWLAHLPYIRYAETMEEAERYIPELLAMGNCAYDNTPLKPYFEKLKDIILEACR